MPVSVKQGDKYEIKCFPSRDKWDPSLALAVYILQKKFYKFLKSSKSSFEEVVHFI